MDAHRWTLVEALLDRLLDLHPAERGAVLDDPAVPDDVRDEVRSLLGQEARLTGFLPDDPVAYVAPLLETADDLFDDEPLASVGPYRIVGTLGRGGMGTVYLAERDDGHFRRRVALKVVRRGLDTDDVLARFRRERQILAALDHPHIARLYDGGVTDDGRPYFALEYVGGRPITDYCDRRRLPTQARLALFETVCDAVQFAHQNLVVHRDLKPSNILVTDEGTVKLLDFGIAKLLGDEDPLGLSAHRTRTSLRLMTPAYAAPEQVRGGAVSTTTDVYQLGVVLFELLTGHRPFDLSARVREAVERAVLEEAPTRPSTLLETRTADDASRAAAARGTSLERLRRELRGDLDNIVLKALQKDQERRYPTVDQLREDLRRHRDGLPVQARPDDLGYRLRKFVRRHRAGVAAGVVVSLLGLGLVGQTVSFAWTTRAKNAQIQAERDKAEQVAAFLVDLFRRSDPNVTEGDTLTARTLLVRGRQRLAEGLADQPEIRARLLGTVGAIYESLGWFAEADTLGAEALALQDGLFPQGHPDRLRTLEQLASTRLQRGRATEAESLLTVARRLSETVYGTDAAETVYLEALRGGTMSAQNRPAEAVAVIAAARARLDALGAPVDDRYLRILRNLCVAQYTLGDYEGAVASCAAGVAAPVYEGEQARQLKGDFHNNLGLLLHLTGRNEEAVEHLLEAEATYAGLYGPGHPRIGSVYQNLGIIVDDLGRPDEAVAYLERAVEVFTRHYGRDHLRVVGVLNDLTVAYFQHGETARGVAAIEEAVAIARRIAPESFTLVNTLTNLGDARVRQARFAEAERSLSEAVALARAVLPDSSRWTAWALHALGHLYVQQGRAAEAEPLLREALAYREAGLDEPHDELSESRLALGRCLLRLGRTAEAEPLLRSAADGFAVVHGADHPRAAEAREVLRAAGVKRTL